MLRPLTPIGDRDAPEQEQRIDRNDNGRHVYEVGLAPLRSSRDSATRPLVSRREPNEFIDRFSLLMRTLRMIGTQKYASIDLGPTQAKTLRHLGRNRGCSQTELARITMTDKALIGRSLETLMERGWVRRKRSEEDGRQYVLDLTAAGARACQRVEQARSEYAEQVVSVLDARDLEDFERIVQKIVGALGATPSE